MNLCQRIGEEHDVELFEMNRHWHIYRCMRCDKVIATVPTDFDLSDVTFDEKSKKEQNGT